MSELGNTLKILRGKEPQQWVSQQTGLSVRTIQRAENGISVDLSTVRALARCYRLKPAQEIALIIGWIRLQIGDAYARQIEIRSKVGKATAVTAQDEFMERFKSVPARYQKELMRAVEREEVLRSIAPLNAMYDQLATNTGE